jgi:hypothetical protein
VQDALLDALVEDGDGGAVHGHQSLGVAAGEGLAHGAEGSAKLGLVGAIDGRLGDGLAAALEGGYVICHGGLFSFARRGCRGGNGMLEEADATAVQILLCRS